MIVEWYFSSKSGAILKKNFKNLNLTEFYKKLLKRPEFIEAIGMLNDSKVHLITNDVLLNEIERNIDTETNKDTQALFYDTNANNSDWDIANSKSDSQVYEVDSNIKRKQSFQKVIAVENIAKNCSQYKSQQDIHLLDSMLPPIAFVRFENGDKQFCKPHELYRILLQSMSNITMVQELVYYKGSLHPPYSNSTCICEWGSQPSESKILGRKSSKPGSSTQEPSNDINKVNTIKHITSMIANNNQNISSKINLNIIKDANSCYRLSRK